MIESARAWCLLAGLILSSAACGAESSRIDAGAAGEEAESASAPAESRERGGVTMRTHRYYFKLYALDAPLALTERSTKADLLKAVPGHILAEARLMGTYARRR